MVAFCIDRLLLIMTGFSGSLVLCSSAFMPVLVLIIYQLVSSEIITIINNYWMRFL